MVVPSSEVGQVEVQAILHQDDYQLPAVDDDGLRRPEEVGVAYAKVGNRALDMSA